MAHRELELTLLSARDLKNVNLFTRMDVYAVASISGDPTTRQCTPTDTSGGRNPSWDATLRFNVPHSAAEAGTGWVHVLLRSERALGDKDIGEVFIPLADILAGIDGQGAEPQRSAAFQVHTVHRGEPRGVLNVAYRLGPVVAPVDDGKQQKPVVMAYPAPQQPFQPQNPAAPYPYQNQPPYYGYAPPQQPFNPQSPAPQKPYGNQHSHGAYASPQQPPSKPQTPAYQSYGGYDASPRRPSSKPQNPAPQQPVKPQNPAPPYQYNQSHGANALPRQPSKPQTPAPRRESYPSPANGNGNGHGTPATQFILCPDIRVTVANTPPATPRSNSTNTNTVTAKPDGPKPKPSYTPAHQRNDTSPVKTDHSWPKPTPQHQYQGTPAWPNSSPHKPIQQDTKVESGRTADQSLKREDSTRIGSSNMGGRAESRPREGYANSSSMPTGGKAHQHQPVQYNRVPSMATATAR